MKRMFKFSLVIILVLLVVVIACNRKKQELIGPSYVAAPEGLVVTSFTSSSVPPAAVNFVLTKVTFNASFTGTVTWILTIVGQQSGAVYEVSGTGNGFTNLVWGGSHTGLFFFRTGETVTATLSFYGSSLKESLDVKIGTKANFNTCQSGNYPKNADFETPVQVLPPSGNWASFNYPAGTIVNVDQGITGVDDDTTQFPIDRKGNRVPAVQGKNFYYIKGLGDSPSFVSGLLYNKVIGPDSIKTTDPNNLWFNVLIYGSGDINAGLDIEFQEADVPGNNVYDQTLDDAWVYHLELKHVGWKLFSIKYSDLSRSTNPELGGHGNNKKEPNRLRQFAFVLLKKQNPSSPVEVFFDYPIFTLGEPFKPCK